MFKLFIRIYFIKIPTKGPQNCIQCLHDKVHICRELVWARVVLAHCTHVTDLMSWFISHHLVNMLLSMANGFWIVWTSTTSPPMHPQSLSCEYCQSVIQNKILNGLGDFITIKVHGWCPRPYEFWFMASIVPWVVQVRNALANLLLIYFNWVTLI